MKTITDPATDSITITDLPIEITLMILRETSLQAVLRFAATNQSFKEQLSNERYALAKPLLISQHLNGDNNSKIIQWSTGKQSHPPGALDELRLLYGVARLHFSILNNDIKSTSRFNQTDRIEMLQRLSMDEQNLEEPDIFEPSSGEPRPKPIEFRSQPIKDGGAQTLSLLIERLTHQSLKQIDLVNCAIGDLGAIALVNMLKKYQFIEEIRLGYNRIEDAGAQAFGECLQHKTSLVILGLKYNFITPQGVASLKQIKEERKKTNPSDNLELFLDEQKCHDEKMEHNRRNRSCFISQVGNATQTSPQNDHQSQAYNRKCSIL